MNDQKKPNDYLACGFKAGTTEMNVVETGRGGMAALRAVFEKSFTDGFGAGYFRVTAVDDRGVTISFRTKVILIIYVGPKIPMMKKAKVASWYSSIANEFATNMTLQIDDLDDLNPANIETRLRASGGAHAPTSFDFTNDSVDNQTE